MFGQMDAGRLKFAIEVLLAEYGKANVFFVAPSTDSNTETFAQPEYGKAPGMVFTDIQNALTACEDGNGDHVFVLPGVYSPAATLVMAKGRVTLSGLPGLPNYQTIISRATAGETLQVTDTGCVVKNLTFHSNGANAAVEVEASHFEAENLTLDGLTTGVALVLNDTDSAVDDVKIRNCTLQRGTIGIQVGGGDAGHNNLDRLLVEDCRFVGNTIDIGETAANQSDAIDLLFKGNTHVTTHGAGQFIDMPTGTHSGLITNCSFAAATPVTAKMDIPATLFWAGNHTEEVIDSTGTVDNRPD